MALNRTNCGSRSSTNIIIAALAVCISASLSASEDQKKPDCMVSLTAYSPPVPYLDRQIIPFVIINTKGKHCPTPQIQSGNTFYLDTTSKWPVGISMRIKARVQRHLSWGTSGLEIDWRWSDIRDAAGTPIPRDHPLYVTKISSIFDKT